MILGNLHQQQLRAMMQLRAMGYGNMRPKLNLIPERREEIIGSPAGDSQARNVMTMKNLEKEKPFQCSYPGCEARFPRMYNLKSHMLCHTGNFLIFKSFRGKAACMSFRMWCKVCSQA